MTNQNMTEQKDFKDDRSHVAVIVTLLIFIMVIALIGNIIVVIVVTKKKRMQTFTNWMILNLSIADLWVALLSIPLDIPMELNNQRWIYGKTLCSLIYPLQTSSVYGSVFTLVALSLSRFWAIAKPFKRQPNIFAAKVIIAAIWFCSLVVVIPYMLVLKYSETNGVQSCSENWTDKQRKTYTIAIFVFQYVFPLMVISIAYTYIIRELCSQKNGENNNCRRKQQESKKVVKLLCIITLVFAICILPYHIFALCVEFGILNRESNYILNLTCYIFLYAHSAINPFIYNIFNTEFRDSFKELCKALLHFLFNYKTMNGNAYVSRSRLSYLPGNRLSTISTNTIIRVRYSKYFADDNMELENTFLEDD
ncbi:orexin receptor type 2 [Hydra vulgaris]|uniref:Galanin receptor type 2 n=1 Tax=Hydra vulgaris TaxID=6087 RepID=T2MJ60_HYDVU|nr:orexin receptor type 2-like [Hydra vulgaris]XP_047127010.1 orexin receptor type 2-like [Hydra vulgaris]